MIEMRAQYYYCHAIVDETGLLRTCGQGCKELQPVHSGGRFGYVCLADAATTGGEWVLFASQPSQMADFGVEFGGC